MGQTESAHASPSTAPDVPVDRGAIGAAVATMLLWASAFVSIRSAAPHFSPGALALGRLLVGAAVLGVIMRLRHEGPPPRAAWPGIITSGLLWFGLYMVALNWGEEKVDAGTAALLVGIGPILIALLGGWLLREGFPTRLLAGMAVSLAGVAVVGFATSDGGGSSALGVLLCLVAAVGFAGGVTSQKPALRHASPLQATTFGCSVAAVATLPFSYQLVTQTADAPLPATLNMIYLGAFPTALAFTTWAYALSRISAGALGSTTYAVPAFAIVISWIFLGEVPGWLAFSGGLLCLAGVAVSRSSKARSRPAQTPGGARPPAQPATAQPATIQPATTRPGTDQR
ncbi:DMT family transporter [Actinomadura spongiicola]|uniref:DMT family transporter n=1 Tax=Actinomadura spongiicola TaxID=2303421 RepID=A0A372GGW2_9ACTN|nr:DMT family transporter [Actinomadura spongiicola]RFS84323.1 DMT family transporter [Actinomadura spongiicola]